MSKCGICGDSMSRVFSATLLRRYQVSYFQCASCGFLQTERPYWLEEAYGAAISVADTGLVQRNFSISAKLAVLIYLCLDPRGSYVDVAGGYGMLTRLMRDIGYDFYWDDKYCENLLARGFEAENRDLDVTAVTAFEVLEHLSDPLDFLSATMRRFKTGNVVLSTATYSGAAPPGSSWWYYAFETGQHIAFYRKDTLRTLARRLGLSLSSAGGLHVFSSAPLRNRAVAAALCGRAAFPLALYVRYRLGSRTVEDHKLLLNSDAHSRVQH